MIHTYYDIISVDNLLSAWRDFAKGKRGKRDVQQFQLRLMDNILDLHVDLASKMYEHGGYHAFSISDPKPRDIHKASVRDRLLHHAIYRILFPFFGRIFISDSYSCRIGKGTHRALKRFRRFAGSVGANATQQCFVLKCDIRKFFASIDQDILYSILAEYIPDQDLLWLLKKVIFSFQSSKQGVGLPLGNLTSQLLVNIYMNEFDQFVKQELKVRHYVRYADDFVILSDTTRNLEKLLPEMSAFLKNRLRLDLHPDKVFIKTLSSGVDFLGWIHFPRYRVPRTATKRKMFRKLRVERKEGSLDSYLSLLSHGNAHDLSREAIILAQIRLL
ncbi:MAG TPA: reverse transcriptase/maturase family protein [Candidatus Paceibacterota bacterium]|nr:reverse transcriptase/maturase family protein [Candidatus Paceibacterota bacterium]